jgi:uncharacterized protein YraI
VPRLPHRLRVRNRRVTPASIFPVASIALGVLVAGTLAAVLVSTAAAQTFTPGSTARVATDDGGCLNLRAGATTTAQVITCLPNGSTLTIREGSATSDGLTWQFVEAAGAFGWVAAMYLQAEGATPTPTPSPTPSPTPTATASPTPTPSPTPSPTPTPGASSVPAGTITGSLPPTGRPSFVVWGGGAVESMREVAAERGCTLRSVWGTADGQFIGYTFGVPAFVNASWVNRFGSSLPPMTAVMVICAAPGQASSTSSGGSTPSNQPVATTGSPPTAPSSQGPPGPAGNDG